MKKLFTLIITGLVAFATSDAFAQSTRMAFVEEATQASCPPCATLNPGLQDLMNDNSDNTIFLAYQVWWPGFDPMYLDNPDEVDVRVGDYYQFEFAPQVVLQGDYVGDGSIGDLTQADLDDVTSDTSEFDMSIDASVLDNVLTVTGTVEATAAASGDLRLRIMLAEDVIYIEDAPGGTNGEDEYHHVFKAFVGGTSGIDLEDDWVDGDTYEINETLDLADFNIYHYDGLEVIAIVQNDDDKYVHQAVKDADVEITSSLTNQVNNLEISDIPASVCSGSQTITPSVKIMNYGNDNLTSCDIVYSVNGEPAMTYNWTGDLATYSTEVVELDPYTFTATDANTLTATSENPNGMDNESTDGISQTADIGLAPQAYTTVTVVLNTDCWGAETSWEFKNSDGDVVASSSTTYGNELEYIEEVELNTSDCYSFHLYDSYGDGMNGSQWTGCDTDGTLEIFDVYGNVVYSYDGSYEFGEDIKDFEGNAALSVGEINSVSDFSIYPNPTSDVANIAFTLTQNSEISVDVLDLTGRVVYSKNMGNLPAGAQLLQIDANTIGNGMYIFNVYSGSEVISERVSIRK